MTDTMKLISPVDGSLYAERPIATEAEIGRVFSAARDAQKPWAALPLDTRIAYCLKALEALLAMRQEIAEELTWQMGRPIRYTPFELNGVEVRTRHMARIAEESLARSTPAWRTAPPAPAARSPASRWASSSCWRRGTTLTSPPSIP